MEKNINYINYLLRCKRLGTLTQEEELYLEQWSEEKVEHADLIRRIEDINLGNETLKVMLDYQNKQSLAEFKNKFVHRKRPIRLILKWASVAAILIVFLWGGFQLTEYHKNGIESNFATVSSITPAKDQAILELGKGVQVDLGLLSCDAVKDIDGILITRDTNGELIVKADEAHLDKSIKGRIKTPSGGYYPIRLSDGTLVKLGPSSLLEFPISFEAGHDRKIKLEGEAYFEVAHQQDINNTKVPFKIALSHQEIEVLGTTFDVRDFPNEEYGRTTLLEGKVRVRTSNATQELLPGHQAIVSKSNKQVQIHKIQSNLLMDQYADSFHFEDESIQEIMNRISRWYDLEVVYQGEVSKELLSGAASKYQSPEQILRLLELTGNVKFRIEGRRIIVMD